MPLQLSPEWGPYASGPDAAHFFAHFVDMSCSPASGIVWAANGNLYPIRAPRRDADGIGDVVVFEWNKPPPPLPPAPTPGWWDRIKAFVGSVLEAEGRAELQKAAADRAMGDAMTQVLSRMVRSHQDDAAGVALDILAVALSIALIPTGVGVIAGVALLGGAVLLATDSYAYALEMGDDDEDAEAFKKKTERYRIIATVLTLPDIAYGGYKAVRELMEIRELRAMDRVTANAATAMSARTANAGRAERLRQIAERANLRAQLRTEQIRAALKLDIVPRGSGVGSLALLLREEMLEDKSALHQFMQYLQVHCTAVHG